MSTEKNTEETITEIAELIDSGERVFLHRETYEILSYPDPRAPDFSYEFEYLVQNVLDVVDMDPDAYIRIDPLPSNDGFQMMDSFAQSVANEQKKEILQDSLRKSKPFRQFRNALDATALEDEWYDFKDAYLRVYVRDLMEVE